MQWVEISTIVNPGMVENVASILGHYGQGGATIEEWQSDIYEEKTFGIKIYVPHSRSYKEVRKDIEQDLSLLSVRTPIQIKERLLKPDDWLDSLKKHFGILEIGDKFIIKPSWICQPLSASTKIIISLDPGAAFGTGLHPTTRLCLLRLERYLKPGMSVLDMGTGSGILAIAAAKLGTSTVLGLDIDPVAVKTARSNARINNVDNDVQIKRGTLNARTRKELGGSFDIALANITARAISELSQHFAAVLKPVGKLIASGIHPQGLDEVLINLALNDFNIEAIVQESEWYLVIAANGRHQS